MTLSSMETYYESGRPIEIIADTQVLVVGGGPSGMAAAIASARVGAKTMLVESGSCFGGVVTQAGVECVAWYRHEGTVEAGGLLREIEDTAQKKGASSPESQSISQALDAELFKVVADEMILDAGVVPLLHCYAVGVMMEDGRITGVITESKSGRKAIRARRVIDCTGDGDIAALAGASFTKAPREKLMQVTPVFHMCGVDTQRFLRYIHEELHPTYKDWGGCWEQEIDEESRNLFSPYIESCFIQAREKGILPNVPNTTFGGTYGSVTEDGGVTQMNVIFMGHVDCTNVFDLTRAEMEGRRNVMLAIEAMRACLPGFENARLRNFAMKLGTRESRKILGRHHLTGGEVMNQARFDDSIGIYPEFIDGRGLLSLPTTGRYFQVPYGVLVPQHVDNLLVAGRSVSGDDIAHCAFRNMSCCVLTGQGAGVAAAVSLQEGSTTQNVSISRVQQALRAQGVRLN